jgi:TonB family protein
MTGIEGLLAGRVLAERYHIEKVIGRGGMGAVYRATDQRLGRPVAVKVIMVPSAEPEARERLRQRFLREAQTAARLRHPNIVTVHDYGTDAELGLDYLVMELMEGEDLATRVSRAGPLAPAAAVELLAQAARGLAAGHRAGLVHRDVKPGNLFLEEAEGGGVAVRVLDYGIVQVALDETLTHLTVAGRGPLSPAYASPEQLRGETRISPASDVFSLGAVGVYALTGEKPFAGGATGPRDEAAAVASALSRVEGMPDLPEGLVPVLRRALEPSPAARVPDANAFREALEAVRGGEGEDARRLAGAVFAPVAARPVAEAPTGPDEDATRLAPVAPGTREEEEEEDVTRLAGPPPAVPPRREVPEAAEPGPREPTTGAPAPRRGGPRWLVPVLLLALAGGAGALLVQRPWEASRRAAADSAARHDSLVRAALLRDSLRRDSLRRDSVERASAAREKALRDSLNALARADSARRVDSILSAPPPRDTGLVRPSPGASSGGRIYTLNELETLPQLSNRSEVRRLLSRRYPSSLRGRSGQVVLQIVINEEGRVDPGSITVVSATDPGFVSPSREVAARMRFTPAIAGGRPVKTRAEIPVQWDS